MNGSLGTASASAITRWGDESRAASAPPIKALLCMLVGSRPLAGLRGLVKAWLVPKYNGRCLTLVILIMSSPLAAAVGEALLSCRNQAPPRKRASLLFYQDCAFA